MVRDIGLKTLLDVGLKGGQIGNHPWAFDWHHDLRRPWIVLSFSSSMYVCALILTWTVLAIVSSGCSNVFCRPTFGHRRQLHGCSAWLDHPWWNCINAEHPSTSASVCNFMIIITWTCAKTALIGSIFPAPNAPNVVSQPSSSRTRCDSLSASP